MSRPPINEIMTTLRMPLRDVAKTLRVASHVADSPLRDISHVLPSPLRDMIKQSMRQADEIGSQLFERGMPSPQQILDARGTLESHEGGQAGGLDGQANLVKTISFAMSEGLKRLHQEDWVVSNVRLSMIVADKLSRRSSDAPISANAALMTSAILASHAVFTLKDLLPSKAPELVEANSVATFASFLWLCIERDTDQDDALLLQLCIDVTLSSQDEVEQALGSQADLAALFDRLAMVI